MMNSRWPFVRLDEVLTQDTTYIDSTEPRTYPKLSVKLFGKGVVLDAPADGAALKMQRHQLARAGQVILSEIWGKKGAIGLVPPEGNGALCTSHFFLFDIWMDRIDPRYLAAIFSANYLESQLSGEAKGTTGYAAVRPKHLLASTIPLPPLVEQRRIVARIEELAARIEEARGLRREAIVEVTSLIPSTLHRIFELRTGHWKIMPMTDAVEIADRQVNPTILPYSALPHISGENMESRTCRLLPYKTAQEDGVRSGNYLFSPRTVLYSKIRPYLQKAVFVEFEGVCSADVYPIRVLSEQLDPGFVMWSLVAGPFTEYANLLSGRTRMPKLNRTQLFGFALGYPSLGEQRKIVETMTGLQAKVSSVNQAQCQVTAELDALLPSILDRAFRGEL